MRRLALFALLLRGAIFPPFAQAVSDQQTTPAFGQTLMNRNGAFFGSDYEQTVFSDLRDGRYHLGEVVIPYLYQHTERILSSQPPTMPTFALDIEHWSQEYLDAAFYSRFQLAELSEHLLMLRSSTYQITQESLERLKADGMPEGLLRALAQVQDVKWKNEEELLKWLAEDVGQAQVDEYASVLTQAMTHRIMPPEEIETGGVSAEEVRQSIEAWNQAETFPRKLKEIVNGGAPKRMTPKRKTPTDEPDDLLYGIENLFKKWGLPRPRTVVISSIALYLLFAFISRKIRNS